MRTCPCLVVKRVVAALGMLLQILHETQNVPMPGHRDVFELAWPNGTHALATDLTYMLHVVVRNRSICFRMSPLCSGSHLFPW